MQSHAQNACQDCPTQIPPTQGIYLHSKTTVSKIYTDGEHLEILVPQGNAKHYETS